MSSNKEIAETILAQLGGNKFTVMTGSKDYLAVENGLRMRLRKNASNANRLEITLNDTDTYHMKFMRVTNGRLNRKTLEWKDGTVQIVKEFDEVYCDMLREIFESVTGLATRL